MKKMLAFVFALLLCLAAVSALAEAVSSSDLRRDALDAIAKTVVAGDVALIQDEASIAYAAAEIEALIEKGAAQYFAETLFLDASGAVDVNPLAGKKIALVTSVPMSIARLEKAEKGIVTIESAVPDVYAEILKKEDIRAVYTYTNANGFRMSALIEYAMIRENGAELLRYQMPEAIVRSAVGLYGMVSFVKVSDL